MPIQRVFLDWKRPALQQVAEQLVSRSRDASFVDLSHLVLVFYGRQAGRRCLELLTRQAGGALCPPRIVTVGQLPELLYRPQRPFASLMIQQLVWAQALRQTPADRLRRFMSLPPDDSDQAGWLRLGELLRKQHEELARDQLDFSDVWKRGASLDGFDEVDRWKLLAEIQQTYWRLLDGFELWDQQTARLEAIKRREIRADFEVVTVGTVDLNRTLRSMLDQIDAQVTAYVPAPPEWANRFDEHGCLLPEFWENQTIDLAAEQVVMADDPAGQCAAVLGILAGFSGDYAVDEVTIGVPDSVLVIPLQRKLDEYGIPSHWPVDREILSTGPYRLLECVADFLEEPSSFHFAALIRHPDVSAWLTRRSGHTEWLTAWDRYFEEHLPRNVDWILPGRHSDRVLALKDAVRELLAGFPASHDRFAAWAAPVANLLHRTYKEQRTRSDLFSRQLEKVCEALNQAFAGHQEIPPELDLKLSAAEAIRLTLRNAAGELYHAESEPAVSLVGWLEMPLDDAPVAIITTFNETFVPTSVNHDLFLPNRLRSHLGIEDNARRYARDLYLLSTLVHGRKVLRLIVARRDASHDPLTPSRLLFATNPEEIAARVLAFYSPQQPTPVRFPPSPVKVAAESAIPIPRPQRQEHPSTEIRVTAFRDFIASPYRYYLAHVVNLRALSDDLDELDAAAFGTLVHDVLREFGRSPLRDSRNADAIAEDLCQRLGQLIAESYGSEPLAAVLIQAEQARRRLKAFAQWQAEWRQQGWQIRAVEHANPEPIPFRLTDGRHVHLKGRIDRIDQHPELGWAIFDYKTGDAGLTPVKTHRRQEAWVDLQLPLYRHLVEPICGDEDVQLGYLVLPRDSNAVTAHFADWSPEDLAEADETARAVARAILDQEFWKPLNESAGSRPEFDPICQTGVFGQEILL